MSTELTLDSSICLQPFSQLLARRLDWLWPGRMAFGKLAIFDGDPGVGKSLLALDLCARLSTGRPFPDGSPSPGRSIVLNGEDGAHDTILARLQAMGADRERVLDFHRKVDGVPDSTRFPEHAPLLGQALEKTGARLVVLDPIMAFLEAGAATGNDASVRQALLSLMLLAEQYRCAMYLSRHLNKGGGAHAVYRGGGSIGNIAACRSGWLVARDPSTTSSTAAIRSEGSLASSAACMKPSFPGVSSFSMWPGLDASPVQVRRGDIGRRKTGQHSLPPRKTGNGCS